MNKNFLKRRQAQKRAWRVRKKVRGNAERPRLSVYRSNKNIYAQVIDDEAGVTLAQASTRDKELRDKLPDSKGNHVAAAEFVGKQLAERLKSKGVAEVSFDRGPYKYHGRVKALAEAARKAGLKF